MKKAGEKDWNNVMDEEQERLDTRDRPGCEELLGQLMQVVGRNRNERYLQALLTTAVCMERVIGSQGKKDRS